MSAAFLLCDRVSFREASMICPSRLLIVFDVLRLLLTAVLCSSGEPPRFLDNYERVIRVQVNESIRLTCPIKAAGSELMFDWAKDDETITTTWERYRQSGPQLKIADIVMDDSGLYECRAVNGYGLRTATIQLIVNDPNNVITTTTTTTTTDHPFTTDMIGWNFTQETLKQPRLLYLMPGSSMDIVCDVVGYYPPLVPRPVWLKNGREHSAVKSTIASGEQDSWTVAPPPLKLFRRNSTLEVRQATASWAGNYTCRPAAVDGAGGQHQQQENNTEITFAVFVVRKKTIVTNVSRVTPLNTTELRGGKARFHCWISSFTLPQVEWLRDIPSAVQGPRKIHPNASLVIGDDQYQRLEGAEELVKKEDGSYWKTLVLDPLHETDAGTYLCLGINPHGITVEKTHLAIKLNYEENVTKSVPLSIYVALPSAMILAIAGGFVCWVRNREREALELERQQSAEPSSPAASSLSPPSFHRSSSTGSGGRQTLMSGASHYQKEVETANKSVGTDHQRIRRTGRMVSSSHQHPSSSNHYFYPQLSHHQQ